ncbi:MAG: carboxymuconolactone decarboxylase family protein, partial [Planctomycetota bacterium]
FLSQYPQIAAAVSGSIEKIMSLAPLDEKTKQLVYIAAQTASCYPLAVKYHVPEALKAGATPDEIVGAMAIASSASGPKGLVLCFSAIAPDLAKA